MKCELRILCAYFSEFLSSAQTQSEKFFGNNDSKLDLSREPQRQQQQQK